MVRRKLLLFVHLGRKDSEIYRQRWKNLSKAPQTTTNSDLFLVEQKHPHLAPKNKELCQKPHTKIIAIVPATGKIKLIMSFKKLGGTRTRYQKK